MIDRLLSPMLIGGLVLGGFLAGAFSESVRYSHMVAEDPINLPGMRAELMARCVAAPDVIAEIQTKLPDNEDGQITPDTIRKVLRDVVSHC